MRFLCDQNIYFSTIQFLRNRGHDLIAAAEVVMSRASDVDLLRAAQVDARLLITRDRDFGGLVFVGANAGGILYLRALPSTLRATHAELYSVLSLYDESELRASFVVIEPGRHRIRRAAP